MVNEKYKKLIRMSFIAVIALLLIWFLIIGPLIQFKKSEKEVLKAGKRYFEINTSQLPTGQRIKTVSLQTLYNKDFIKTDINIPNSSKSCDTKASWIKVRKENNEYKYYVYLKCGVFSSKTDHTGPTVTLNGKEEITLNRGDEYKEEGIKSVKDNTDGTIDIQNVKIDSSKVNTNKNGTYRVTYTIKDSFGNETIKIRTIKVVQVLDKLVEKETDKTNYYKGQTDNNYIKLDGILFKIVGVNDDGSVKITSSEPLAAVDYNNIDTWLNEYFYEKLSDSAKEYIKTDSKWCNEKITDTSNYTKCNSYSKKKAVGLLSIADINNSKDAEGNNNLLITNTIWTSNLNNKTKSISYNGSDGNYQEQSINDNYLIYPTLNIKTDSYISKGTGYIDNPYVLKGNGSSLKAGEKISNAKVGEYISYSGYLWRIIGKEQDETTKVIMDGIVNSEGDNYYAKFAAEDKVTYSITNENNIGYHLVNKVPTYLKTNIFEKKKESTLDYKQKINYKEKTTNKTYSSKIFLPNMYDLFSTTNANDYWYINHSNSKNKVCYMVYTGEVFCNKYTNDTEKGIRIVAYIKGKITVKIGSGQSTNSYTLAT